MKFANSKNGSIKAGTVLLAGLFCLAAGGVYAQCSTTITIPDNLSNTEIARFVSISPEGYIVRKPGGYFLSTTDNQAFEDDLNDNIIEYPGLDTGYDGIATIRYDDPNDEWIIVFTGDNSQLSHSLSYRNGTTQTCPGGLHEYCGTSVEVTATHSAECAAEFYVDDVCTSSAYCGAPDVGAAGYCYDGVCEELLDCSDSQYIGRECLSNQQCGDGGGCRNGMCECMNPGPGVCYPGYSEPICDTEDPDACGGAPNVCELGGMRYQCVCDGFESCGNGAIDGAVDAGEECDDGNNYNGDGCGATCDFEIPSCEILLPSDSVAIGSSISIQILSQSRVAGNTATLYTGYSTSYNVAMNYGIGTRNSVPFNVAGNYIITGIVYSPLDTNTFAICTGDLAVYTNGDCGSLFMTGLTAGTYDEPIYDDVDLAEETFCDVGSFDEGTYKYTAGEGRTWECAGEGGGAVVDCNAYELPVCGPADGGQFDELLENDSTLCSDSDYLSGFSGVIPPSGENYDAELVTDPSYIWQCATPSGSVNCQAEYVDSPMCDYPVGTPCDSSDPGPGTNYDGTWNATCLCVLASSVCGDGNLAGSEDCEHPTYCDDGSSCTGNSDCTSIGDEICLFRRFCDDVPGEVCSSIDACSVGVCGGYDLTPGCEEDCTASPVVCDGITETLPDDGGPYGISTLFEMEIDASSNPWADTTINRGDDSSQYPVTLDAGGISNPSPQYTYGDYNNFSITATVTSPFDSNVTDTCIIGPYNIVVNCGNGGDPEPGEECDDGNLFETDLCNNLCQFTYCGDNIRQNHNGEDVAEECDGSSDCSTACECDPGFAPTVTGTCTSDPVDGVCGAENSNNNYDADNGGDSLTSGSPELCDVGDVINFSFDTNAHKRSWDCAGANGGANDGCTASELYCGDGLINGIEECDGETNCISCACDLGYTWNVNNSSCEQNVCQGTVPDYASACTNLPIPSNNTTDYVETDVCDDQVACDFTCNPGYTWNVNNSSCEQNVCQGTVPDYASACTNLPIPSNNTTDYVETDVCDDQVACDFTCNAGYTWNVNNSSCEQNVCQGTVPDNAMACTNLPIPSNNTTYYVETDVCDDQVACDFTCNPGFEFDAGICVAIILEECGDIDPYWTQDATTPTGELCTNSGDPATGPTAQSSQPEEWDWTCADEVGCSVINHYCGDGITDNITNGWISDDEECDDGNTTSGDGCSDICETEVVCGDGVVQTPPEECDEAGDNDPNGTCTSDCTLTFCGDSITQSPNGLGTGGPSNNGVESCDEGLEGGVTPDGNFCTSSCQLNGDDAVCAIEVHPDCGGYTIHRWNFGNLSNGLVTIGGQSALTIQSTNSNDAVSAQRDGIYAHSGDIILYTATANGTEVTCQTEIGCNPVNPIAPPHDDDGASGVSGDPHIDLGERSQILFCEDAADCKISYKRDEQATDATNENTQTVEDALATIEDDSKGDTNIRITPKDLTDAFARALYIQVGSNTTALKLLRDAGFFDDLQFQDGVIMKKDLITAMMQILTRLGLLNNMEIDLTQFEGAADKYDLRRVAVTLRKILQSSYVGFNDPAVRERVAVGERSTGIAELLCRRNGIGCTTQTHQAADDAMPAGAFIDVDPTSRVGQALTYVNAQRHIFDGLANQQQYFDEDGVVQLGVLFKTLALAVGLDSKENSSVGSNRASIYLNALQTAGYFTDITMSTVAWNHSVTRGELQQFLTQLLQTAHLLPSTSVKAGPSTKLTQRITRGELVLALQQLIQLFEVNKQQITNDIISRGQITPGRDAQ